MCIFSPLSLHFIFSVSLFYKGVNRDLHRSKTSPQLPCKSVYPLIFLPGEVHTQSSLVGYSPWGCQQLDTAE